MEDCIFCKIGRGEIACEKVWEDDDYLAFLDRQPINPGHTLIIPKKHTDYLFDLNDADYETLFLKAKKLAKDIQPKLGAKRIGVVVEGFGVPHVHVHLVPINEPFEIDPKRAKPASSEELEKIGKKLRAK